MTLEPVGELLPHGGEWPRKKRPTPDEAVLGEKDRLVLDLVEMGVSLRKAEDLVVRFPYGQIRQQLQWLPFRGPKKPASLLIASIEHNYDPPVYAPNN